MQHDGSSTADRTVAFDLRDTFVHLSDLGEAVQLPVTADFWTNMDPRLDTGRLVSRFTSESDWSQWEMHPRGDEVILLLSGRVTLLLEVGPEKSSLPLKGGDAIVIPAGAWHTADVHDRADMLFITPGEETQHRPRS